MMQEKDLLLQLQSLIDSKTGGNRLTYRAYSGLTAEFYYPDGSKADVYAIIDGEGSVIAIGWNGELKGPIRGQFLHNGNPLGTQFVNIQRPDGSWRAILLNSIPSECLPLATTPPQPPSFLPPAGPIPPGFIPPPSPPSTIISPPVGISTGLPVTPPRDFEEAVPSDQVVICLEGFYIKSTGINYLPTDRISLYNQEEFLRRNDIQLIPIIDGDGRIVGSNITGDTCGLPGIPVPYIPSITGVGAQLIPIPRIVPIPAAERDQQRFVNADGTVIKPPIRTVYCYRH